MKEANKPEIFYPNRDEDEETLTHQRNLHPVAEPWTIHKCVDCIFTRLMVDSEYSGGGMLIRVGDYIVHGMMIGTCA